MAEAESLYISQVLPQVRKSLSVSDSILLYLSVVLEGNDAENLFQHVPLENQEQIQPHLQTLMSFHQKDRYFPLLEEVQSLSQVEPYRGLDDMEGSWILHYLKDEKPTVIGLILSRLSADKVYQILNRMDPKLRALIPSKEELESVDDAVVSVVKKQFEEQLSSLPRPVMPRELCFECILNMSSMDLVILVEDEGLSLIATAFHGLKERSLIELVKNLEEQDAEKLYQKFGEEKHRNRGDIKSAQLEILNLSLDFRNSSDFIMEAGVQRLARALILDSDDYIKILQHRMPLRAGYQLERYVQDFRRATHPEGMAQKLKENFLARLVHLSEKGMIEASWSKMKRGQRMKMRIH